MDEDAMVWTIRKTGVCTPRCGIDWAYSAAVETLTFSHDLDGNVVTVSLRMEDFGRHMDGWTHLLHEKVKPSFLEAHRAINRAAGRDDWADHADMLMGVA